MSFRLLSCKIVLATLCLGWMRLGWAASPAMTVIPSTVFNITNYGAVGDGTSDNTTAIQTAINTANAAGGGMVEVPAGKFSSGPITLLSSINLHLDAGAALQMLPLGTYPGGATNAQTFIGCNGVQDVEISGTGKIDGQGAAWWTYFGTNSSIVRPMMLNLFSANRLFIHDVTYTNPPYHHCGLRSYGGNITISNLTVSTPAGSPNTDGLNFVGTNSIIENCHISDGDDNIAMGSTGPLNDLLITNCTFGTGHGVSIGSGISVGLSNLTVMNCTFSGTTYGIRMKSDTNSGGPVQNLKYLNLSMTNVLGGAITIYSYYNESGTPTGITPGIAAGEVVSPVNSTTPMWRNILFSNITATVAGSGVAGIIWARTEMPASNIVMSHVNITAPKTFDVYSGRGILFLDSTITTGTGKTFTLWNSDVTVSNSVPGTNVITLNGLAGTNSLALYNVTAALTSTDLFAISPLTLSGCAITNTDNLVCSNNQVFNFALGTNRSMIAVATNLTLRGTLNVTNGAGFAATNYLLFTYTGVLTNALALEAQPPLHQYLYRLDTNTPGQVRLVVTTPPAPSIAGVGVGSGNHSMIVSGTGGLTNGAYYVLSATNLTLPASQWVPVSTNPFDASGNFIFTNMASPTSPPTFFRLQLVLP